MRYWPRANTKVMSSGCSLAPIQSSTAAVTISLIRASGRWRLFPHQINQPLFAELAKIIFRFGYAIAVGEEYVAPAHGTIPSL